MEELALFQGAPRLPVAKEAPLAGFQRAEEVHSSSSQRAGAQTGVVNGLPLPG